MSAPRVNLGIVPWPDGRATVVAKLTFTPSSDGVARLTEDPDDLTLDIVDAGGELLYPSDFAPYKPTCDIVVVGTSVLDRNAQGSVSAGSMTKNVESLETLGPRAIFCPRGDPTPPHVAALWSTGQIEPSRFQIAAPDQRMPWPTQPFALHYARGSTSLSMAIEGPVPSIGLPSRHGGGLHPMALDTVLIDPSRGRVSLLFRCVCAAGEIPAKNLVWTVALAASLASPALIAGTTSARVVAPRELSARAPVHLHRVGHPVGGVEATRAITGPIATRALPFVASDGRRRKSPGHLQLDDHTAAAVPRADAFPFPGPVGHPKGRTLTPRDLETLRSADRAEPAWQADGETNVMRVSHPTAHAPPLPTGLEATAVGPAPATFAQHPALAFPVARAPEPAPEPATPAEPQVDEAGLDAIQNELWQGRPLGEALARHGVTEDAWRAAQRTRRRR